MPMAIKYMHSYTNYAKKNINASKKGVIMANTSDTCETCRHVTSDTDRHGDTSYQCCRYPPTIINSSSPAVFPKVLPTWSCGEFSRRSM